MSGGAVLEAALSYAALGYGVFPLVPNAKNPASKNGLKDAVVDPDAVRTLFANADYNLGLLPPAHVLGVDVDDPLEWPELLERFPELDTAPCHKTVSEGCLHLFLRVPDGWTMPTKTRAAPGVDVRGLGRAYLVAPPSVIDGRAYEVVRPLIRPEELPLASNALLAYLKTLKAKKSGGRLVKPEALAHGQGLEITDSESYARAALLQTHDRLAAVAEGGRHTATVREASALGALAAGYERAGLQGLTEEEAREALKAACVANGSWDDDEEDAARAIEDGLAYGRARPPEIKVKPGGGRLEPDMALATFKLTDLGNGERLAYVHGDRLLHVNGLGWLVYDGRRWARDTTGEVQRMAADVIRSLYAVAARLDDDAQRGRLVDHARRTEGGRGLEAMIERARAGQSIRALNVPASELDLEPDLLNVANGTIDLRTGELRPHDPADRITKLAPVEYDPEARAPMWEAFQLAIAGDDTELVEFKQRAWGYTATGHTREHKVFVAWGTGSNGKSTEHEVIAAALGDYAASAPFDTFASSRRGDAKSQRFSLATLAGARFVRANEGEDGIYLSEGVVKDISGGQAIVAEFKGRDAFEYTPKFSLWLSSNHKPRTRGTDHGLWRRLRLVPYAVSFVTEADREKDPARYRDAPLLDDKLPARLLGELPGVLRWVVDGAVEWHAGGLGSCRAVDTATSTYQAEMDRLGDFLAECVEEDAAGQIRSSDLYRAYCDWCAREGEAAMKQKPFTQALNQRGYTKHAKKHANIWVGVRLVESEPFTYLKAGNW